MITHLVVRFGKFAQGNPDRIGERITIRSFSWEALMPVRRYLGARTAFGIIVHIAERLYNPEAVVEAKDGSTRFMRS